MPSTTALIENPSGPFGRFIEIGKMSCEHAPLGLAPFNENLLFASVDFDRLLQIRPDYVDGLIGELLALMETADLGVVPVTGLPASRVHDAFRLMARAKHIGKVWWPCAIPS